MKIISKHKDYYDYLVGIYGMDEIMVYERNQPISYKWWEYPSDDTKELTFHIAGKEYTVYQYKDKFYHLPKELQQMNELVEKDGNKTMYLNHWWRYGKKDKLPIYQRQFDNNNGNETSVNMKLRLPVVVEYYSGNLELDWGRRYGIKKYDEVLLQNFGFPSWYSADYMWKEIYAFISKLKDHPPMPDNQTNEGKILSHGFDKKQSFRHRK